MDLLKLNEAAHELGVSYPTIKQWIYRGKLKSVLTAGGHHRIPRAEIHRLSVMGKGGRRSKKAAPPELKLPKGPEHFISGRNQLIGRVTKVQISGLMAKVVMDIGGQSITAIITSDACRGLTPGATSRARCSSNSVIRG